MAILLSSFLIVIVDTWHWGQNLLLAPKWRHFAEQLSAIFTRVSPGSIRNIKDVKVAPGRRTMIYGGRGKRFDLGVDCAAIYTLLPATISVTQVCPMFI